MPKRSPIIVIMGSVDHGKTTLLDYIRKTNVAAKEAGGITQSIGAYEIVHPSASSGQAARITFIDTPGHEAFGKMKTRGAHVADVAILVVAADDGVQPQTKAAIKILKETKTTFIVAINKIDKEGVDPNKIKNELMQSEVFLEGYGGDVSNQEISAKSGQGVNELLDLVLLASELEDLEYDPAKPASGLILESKMDSRRGVVATVIVTDGTLRFGDLISTESANGKVKMLENFLGKAVKEISPSSPALIFGLESLPKAGENFVAGKNEPNIKIKKVIAASKTSESDVNVILKADVSGSLEALAEIVKSLPLKKTQKIEIIEESVGDITDGDVKLAISTKAVIVGFKTKITKPAEALALDHKIKIIQSEIVYDLLKVIEQELAKAYLPQVVGRLEILAIFGESGKTTPAKATAGKQIIGGKVIEGVILNKSTLAIERNGSVIGELKITNLQQGKKDAGKIETGNECGLLVESTTKIAKGDLLLYRT
ncbi:MAG: translation initiation factor IF-2 [Parcubacteria group bacterium Gr01-1014_3]|nr:MAG: translation initiation factor IF-2 [Parcubacteria group bacterium Gr01-1014_3]